MVGKQSKCLFSVQRPMKKIAGTGTGLYVPVDLKAGSAAYLFSKNQISSLLKLQKNSSISQS